MNRLNQLTRFLLLFLIVACSGLGYLVWRQHREAQAWLAEKARYTELLNRLSAKGKLEGEGIHAPIGGAPAERAESSPSMGKEEAKPRNKSMDTWLAKMTDPTIIGLGTAQQQARIKARYRQLFSTLGLSDPASQQVTNLLVQKQNAALDVAIGAQENDPALLQDPNAFNAMVRQEQAALENEIASIMGPDAYPQYQAFEQDQKSTQLVQTVQGLLSDNSIPALTGAQNAQLKTTIDQLGAKSISTPVLNAAQSFLDPTQMQALQQLRQQELNGVQLRNLQLGVAAPHG